MNALLTIANKTLAKAGAVARQQRASQHSCRMSSKRSFRGSLWGLRGSHEEKHV